MPANRHHTSSFSNTDYERRPERSNRLHVRAERRTWREVAGAEQPQPANTEAKMGDRPDALLGGEAVRHKGEPVHRDGEIVRRDEEVDYWDEEVLHQSGKVVHRGKKTVYHDRRAVYHGQRTVHLGRIIAYARGSQTARSRRVAWSSRTAWSGAQTARRRVRLSVRGNG